MTGRYANPINNLLLRDNADSGALLPAGYLKFYAAGTSTPLAVYSDAARTVSLGSELQANSDALIADHHLAAGTLYKLVGEDSLNNVMWTVDDVFAIDDTVDARVTALESTVSALSIPSRNVLPNGGARVQEGEAATLTASFLEGVANGVYGAISANVTAGTISAGADVDYASGSYFRLSGVSTSGAANAVAQYRIPSADANQFTDSAAVFSCDVEQDTGSDVDYTITIKKPTVKDAFGTLTTVLAGSADTVASGTKTALTALSSADVGDVSNGIVVEVSAALTGAVTTKNFDFSDAQFELGQTATTYAQSRYYNELSGLAGTLLNLSEIALTSSDVTLTDRESRTAHLLCTGTLTANVNVIVPTTKIRQYRVTNATSGAYTVTVKTSAGTGIEIPAGEQFVRCDGANVVFDDPVSVGWGQSWSDVTGSRAKATAYTNTTGRPIFVSVYIDTSSGTCTLTVDSVVVAKGQVTGGSQGQVEMLQAIVPDGVVYQADANGALQFWTELS